MAAKKTKPVNVVLSLGGEDEHIVDLRKHEVPDLWHILPRITKPADREAVREVWHLSHDLRQHILKKADGGKR
jgi:hypothetical protein